VSWIELVNLRISSGSRWAKSGTFTRCGISFSGFLGRVNDVLLVLDQGPFRSFSWCRRRPKLSRYWRAVSKRKRQMWAATSESLILMWHDSTANLVAGLLLQVFADRAGAEAGDVFRPPVDQTEHRLTTCVA